ncbi:tRNA (adenosine(37)-N6)-dimethylallyltransferase MiaA [Oceanidesulfovibrio marinus]|uniref:tRNA dimethylallyltransferase n=1 Tax=Oceanidesulfovibrio marinus TaxID=370038 RepID=A0A6P1ZIN8_9BACT|nr:tRNA (adenosine(37)-N6)-dimethylallyltransferase MiaA [Oceanidesulfovibrio marinus]TVM34537.1 tRNA (adenosine(37)-N6)-dimethylallyltransferase MiaA [Oceanidesulfovibrio marinus]
MDAMPVICLLGVTGAGKTAASLALAEALPGSVVNLDSRQVYREFPVITAQPSPEERAVAPHYLYGFLPCTERISAGVFAERAHEACAEVRASGRYPLLVGGAGLYLRAFLEGLAPIPPVDEAVRESLEQALDRSGLAPLRKRLEEADPEYAAAIHPNDTQRTLRALEVYDSTGKPLSWWHAQPTPTPQVRPLKLFLEVEQKALHRRLDERISQMLEAGAVDEARKAMDSCPDPDAPGWSGIGCAELHAYLSGGCPLPEARALWLRNTKAYAKRQMTWFRKESDMMAVPAQDVNRIVALASRFLETV